MKNSLGFLILMMCTFGCGDSAPRIPKPRAYPKVEYPVKSYTAFQKEYCDFTFDVPVYATINKESSYFDKSPESECWFDISYGNLNGNLHCSYYDIQNRKHFDKLVSDAFTLVNKHQKKLNFQEERLIEKDNNVYGISFELNGPVASPMQFFLTDSTRHFMRGSLYFDNQVNPDSMAPIHHFVMQDVRKMIETFEWVE